MTRQLAADVRADAPPTRSDEGRVQRLYPVGGHDDFNVSPRVEAIQLVEQLQHGPLDLPLAAGVGVIPADYKATGLKSSQSGATAGRPRDRPLLPRPKVLRKSSAANALRANGGGFKNRTVGRVAKAQQPAWWCGVKTINNNRVLELLTPRRLAHF